MINTNELFSVVEFSPTVFAKTKPTDMQYRLTLILRKEEASLLFLSSPGFRPSFPDATNDIETIIQVVFSDFLLDLFLTNDFAVIGQFLRRLPGNLLFSPAGLMQVKDSIIRLRKERGFESTLLFLNVMKALATANDPTMQKEEEPRLAGLSQAANKINKVKNYVKENYRNRITISEIACIAGFSANSFSRFFKQHTGMNFVDYVNGIRVEAASRLLQKTDDTVLGIAYSCGFNTPCYFDDVFRRHKGMTPGEFRTPTPPPSPLKGECEQWV